jgi:hypothetical protein
MLKFLTPYGRRVLVAVPLSIATAVFFFFAMWAVPEAAYFWFMLMLAGPAIIFEAITEEV